MHCKIKQKGEKLLQSIDHNFNRNKKARSGKCLVSRHIMLVDCYGEIICSSLQSDDAGITDAGNF